MKLVDYTDESGFKFKMQVPDDAAEDTYKFGTPYGPPDISELGLPPQLQLRLHNQLFDRDLFTLKDVQRQRVNVMGAWQAALTTDVESIVQIYARAETPTELVLIHNGPHPSQVRELDTQQASFSSNKRQNNRRR